MASGFPAFSSKKLSKSVRVQIALAVIVVAAIAVTHVALQAGFVSFGSGASAEHAGAEPQANASDSVANAGPVRLEPVHRDLIIKRGAAVAR